MVEEQSKTQKKFSLDAQTVTKLFRHFFFYTGEVTRSEFAKRIVYVALAAFVSFFWIAIPLLHSLFLLGTIASLASLVVRRLRNLNYHWAFVFLGLLPFFGWITLAVFAVLKPRSQDDDGLPIAKIALSAGATFVAIALLTTSLSLNNTDLNATDSETSQSTEGTVADQEQMAAEEAAEAEAQEALEEEEAARLAEEAAEAEREAEEAAEAEREAAAEAEKAQTESEAQTSNQSFEQIIAGLTIQPEVVGGYDRDLFRHWIDADGDGCDTRREVLIAESTTPVNVGAGCSISGGTWVSAYDGVTTSDASKFDVDHFVPLAEAWRSGAHAWDSTTRRNFANDLGYEMSLIAVSASSNRSKSDRDPSRWMPPSSSFKCEYVYSWIQVKLRWKLTIDSAEATALQNNWTGCSVENLNFKGQASGATIGTAPTPRADSGTSAQPPASTPEPVTSGCININTASYEELLGIVHIGATRAQQLISLRPFSSINDLARIDGISSGGVRLNEIKAQGLACLG